MSVSKTTGWEATVKRQTINLAYWTAAWLVTLAVATFGPKFLWQSATILTLAAVGLNLLVGLGMIRANKNHLRSLDEMQQKIQLEAMGLTLGIGLVVGLAYSNSDLSGIIPFHAEISHLVLLMGLTYLATLVFSYRKFR
jgi:hypothetical protein